MATILQQPDQYSFAGNIKNIIIATEEKISFILKHDSVVLFESSYEPDLNDHVEIDIKKIVQDALSSVMPGTGDITTRNFPAFSYAVDAGQDVVFYAFEGGVDAEIASSWFAGNFLTWQPQTSYVTWNQAQFLSYIALQACNLKIKGYFADDTTQTITFAALELNKINTANLQFSTLPVKFGNKQPQYVDVWTENAQAERLSYVQRFVLKNTTFDDDLFIFKNTLGGWDSVVFTGSLKNEGTSDVKTFAQEDTTSEYQVDITEKYSKNTGLFISDAHRKWVLEFFKTKERFYLSHRAIYEQITVLSSSLSSQKSNPSSYSLTFSLSKSTKFLNLSRTETPDLPLEIIDPAGELFFLAPRLAEFPDSELSDEIILPTQSPYVPVWGKLSLGALKSWVLSFVSTSEIGTSSHNHVNKSILDKISALLGSNDAGTVNEGSVFSGLRSRKEFLRKDVPDTAAKKITFTEGIKSDAIESKDVKSNGFVPGFEGEGFSLRLDENGNALLDVDIITARKSANFKELIIQQQKYQGGIVFYTAAAMECSLVTEQADSYRCFFDTKDGQLPNDWILDDQARCQRFAGKYYWRKVIALGDDYIDISKSDTDGAGIPEKGDMIVQFGNRTDTTRQSAIVTTTIGVNAPRTEFYEGINSYSLIGKLITVLGMKDGKAGIYTNYGEFAGKVTVGAGSSGLTELSEWAAAAQDIQDAQSTANQGVQAAANAQSFIDNTLPPQIAALQAQIDGQVESWDFPYAPTLSNYPASEWTSDVLKDRHIHDTFYNNQPFVDNATTPDAGKAWRFTKSEGVYFWNPISDSDAVKALADAARAQDTADGKRRVFVTQPTTPYDVGDLWTQGTNGELMRCVTQRLTGAYVAGDWEKAVKYTDDTAVNSLQVGGRNLFPITRLYASSGATNKTSNGFDIENWARTVLDSAWVLNFLKPNQVYTMTYDIEIIYKSALPLVIDDRCAAFYFYNGSVIERMVGLDYLSYSVINQGGKARVSQQFTTPSDLSTWTVLCYTANHFDGTNQEVDKIRFSNVKLEIGNKATDWTPAPEDVQADITAAQTSANNAQTSANTANAAVASLNTYVDGSFKDGIITETEAQAIEKYTNSVNASKLQIQSAYTQLCANAYLEGTAKTNLASAKTALDTAITNLLASIAAAIADGQTTPTEKADVDAKFALYNSALSTYQTRVEEANKAIQDKLKTYSDAASMTATEAMNYIDNILPNDIASLQAQIDGVIDSWYFAYVPSLLNFPASDWTTDTIKARHVGDTFTNTQPFVSDVETPDAGKSWRFAVNAGVYFWTPIADSDAVKALLAASQAQDTADSKRRNFVIQPFTPYEAGDMWSQGSAGDLMKCVTTRLTGTFNAADWEKAVKYTDDTAANAAAQSAQAAQADADTANSLLADISSDNKFTPVEKQQTKIEWDAIVSEKGKNDAQADAFSVSKTAYGTKYTALSDYITPLLANLATTSDITGTDFRTKFKEYYDARTDLLNAIATAAKAQAIDAASTDATNKVNAVQVGGVNLLENSIYPLVQESWLYIDKKLKDDEIITVQIWCEGTGILLCYCDAGYSFGGTINTVNGYGKLTYSVKPWTFNQYSNGIVLLIATGTNIKIKVERGNKATDWTPAPEDVAADIATVQASATSANNAVSALNTYVDSSFKDGVIEASEAKAIEKYKNVINDSKSAAENEYNNLYINSYLEGTPKTNLLNAKITLFGAVDNLLASVNTAIADGKTTAAEKADVDSKYSTYITAMGAYKAAVEAAGKAIQDKLNSLSSDKVNAVQIGGRNLFPITRLYAFSGATNKTSNGFDIENWASTVLDNAWVLAFLKPNQVYTMTYDIEIIYKSALPLVVDDRCAAFYFYNGSAIERMVGLDYSSYSVLNQGGKARVSQQFTTPADLSNWTVLCYTANHFDGTNQEVDKIRFSNVKLEIGNKATDWTPAPEDVDAKINTAQSAAASAQATADIAAAKTEGFTEITGGLVTTNIIKLMDALAAAETAGINGLMGTGDNPAFYAGGTYAQALQALAAIILRHNGSAKIGDLLIDQNGVVRILDPVTGKERFMLNAAELTPLATLLDSAQITGSQYNSGVSLTDTGSSIRPNTLSVTQANSKLSLVGGWSISALAPTTGTALVYAHIYILKDGAFYTSVKSVNLTLNVNNSSEAIIEPSINFSLSSVPVGVYSVAVDLSISEDGSHDTSVNLTLDESTISFVFEKDIKQVRFGTDGQMLFYAADKYLYLTSKTGVPFIKSRGDWDIPGLRSAVNISSGGVATKMYGISIVAELTSQGLYTITHNIGHSNYTAHPDVINASARINAVVTAKFDNYCTVRIVNVYTDALTNSAFDLTICANG